MPPPNASTVSTRNVATGSNLVARWLEAVILCLSLGYLCGHALPKAWTSLNTDFPNYYLAARLAHEGYDTSRMYEWTWIEREKDHRGLDVRTIGLLPITPFSTLAMSPLSGLPPLRAKHVWILLNLSFLIPIAMMLRSITALEYRRIALALTLCFPLYRNLEFGQYYILILLLILAACCLYLRGFRALAGGLIGIAAACKVFPGILLLFFLRRRDWRGLFAGIVAGIMAVAASVAVFGWTAERTWLDQILPWTLRGEGLQPYVPTASISGVLHRLFLWEPQWNPHPFCSSPICYAVLLPALQMLLLAPSILLICKNCRSRDIVLLEWAGLLTAALVVSTIPASYNFVLMVFPACVVASLLLRRRQYGWLAALIAAYLGIGFPVAVPQSAQGLALLLYVPRLPLMVAVLIGIYILLWGDSRSETAQRDHAGYAWAAMMAVAMIVDMHSTLYAERAQRTEYAYRLPLKAQGFLNSGPQPQADPAQYVAFTFAGYHLVSEAAPTASFDSPVGNSIDDLSFTDRSGDIWVERASIHGSQIVALGRTTKIPVNDGHDPELSADGESLAFLHDDHGRSQLMLQGMSQSSATHYTALTPPALNVYEVSYFSTYEYAFSASVHGGGPHIYLHDSTHSGPLPELGESRYPSISPNGRWMAFSRLDGGMWNLWLRDQTTGAVRRVADVPCNQIQPAWEADSKTLIYGTDCGRSIWFTALARRRVIP